MQVSSYLFAGGVLSNLVLIPAIAYFGGDSLSKVVDETGKALAFNQLGASQIWSNYVRYIGAGRTSIPTDVVYCPCIENSTSLGKSFKPSAINL